MKNNIIRFRKILIKFLTPGATRRGDPVSNEAAFISVHWRSLADKALTFNQCGGHCPPYNSVDSCSCRVGTLYVPTLYQIRVGKKACPPYDYVDPCGLAFRPTLFSSSNKKRQPRIKSGAGSEGRPTIKNADFLFNLSRAWPAPTKAASRFVMVLVSALASFNAIAQTMTYEQVLQQVVDNYPSLQTTAIAVERARLESVRVESQLGWQLNAAAGVQHDMSPTFGTPLDTLNLNGNMSRLLESGDTLGFVANINRLDADSSFPGAPNPALSTHVGANYRMPLQKGADNTSFAQSRLLADVAVAQANADRRNVYDQIAAQVIDLYINAAGINARIDNTKQAIQRSQRLLKYNQDRAGLGIAEDKDLLQVRAQLRSREADLSGLEMQWQAQRINLNRLMGRDIDADLQLQRTTETGITQNTDDMLQQATQHSPAMSAIQVRLQQADTALELSRDKRKDKLDLVLNAGYKTLSGDSTPSDVNENEVVGGVQLEYGRGLDLSGYDAELQQAQLSRSAALQDQKQVLQDLRYNLAAVLAEINAGKVALSAYEKSVASEQAKLKEAEQRYKRGRSDTDQLVQYEAQLATAELSYDLQGIELARRAQKLRLLLGDVWKTVKVDLKENAN